MWNLHNLSSAYGQRPSAIIGISDDWAAYQFDLAVLALGRHVEAGLADKRSINSLLETPGDPAKQFGDIRSLARGPLRRVKIGPDGTW